MFTTGATTQLGVEKPPAEEPPVATETNWKTILRYQESIVGRDIEIFGTGISYRGPVSKIRDHLAGIEFELAWCASRKMDGKSNPWKICDTISFVAMKSVVPQIIANDRLYFLMKQKWPALILRKYDNLRIPLEHDLFDARTIALIEAVAIRQGCHG